MARSQQDDLDVAFPVQTVPKSVFAHPAKENGEQSIK